MAKQYIPKNTLQRLPLYLSYLKSVPESTEFISATTIADELGFNHVQVRKDLACVSSGGRPRVGYRMSELIVDLQKFFAKYNFDNAVVVGMNPLGRAITVHEVFHDFGFRIIAAFDNDEQTIGKRCGHVEILSEAYLYDFCSAGGVLLGIITAEERRAQEICDTMVAAGVIAIWNFSTVRLEAPPEVLVYNESLAASLAALSAHIKQST